MGDTTDSISISDITYVALAQVGSVDELMGATEGLALEVSGVVVKAIGTFQPAAWSIDVDDEVRQALAVVGSVDYHVH